MKFSVAISVYKSLYLRECIDSILHQTYVDFELIILNDASPYPIREIVDSFHDDRIRYYENETNVGAINLVENWNSLLSLVNGEFMICMGDDDKLLPNCLKDYNNLLLQYPSLDVYHGLTEIINENSEIVNIQEPRPIFESVYSLILGRWTYRRNQYVGDFLYRVETLKRNGGFVYFPLAWGSDDVTAYIAASKNGIANTQVPVFQYRQSPITITSTGSSWYKIEAIEKEKQWAKSFIACEPASIYDRILLCHIKEEFERYFRGKKQYVIHSDVKSNGVSRWLYWLMHKGKASISLKELLWFYFKYVC
ncbi:MAG: glycosyltransferase [Bacteroidales bacterium]|nr:glycosyltransferase [Bacteroidales bacterium]